MTQAHTSPTPPTAGPAGSNKLVLVAAGVALLAVILVNVYVEAAKSEAAEAQFVAYVLNASAEPGDRLDRDDVREVRFPASARESFQTAGFIVLDEDSAGIDEWVDKDFTMIAPRNALLRYDHFAIDSLQAQVDVTPGKRIVALPVNARSLPASLRPGIHVDLEAAFAGRGVLTVMENVRVIAVGQLRLQDTREGEDRAPSNFSKIDIELDPQQATDMTEIANRIDGGFLVHVRPPGDTATPKTEGSGINQAVLQIIGQPARRSGRN